MNIHQSLAESEARAARVAAHTAEQRAQLTLDAWQFAKPGRTMLVRTLPPERIDSDAKRRLCPIEIVLTTPDPTSDVYARELRVRGRTPADARAQAAQVVAMNPELEE